MTPRAHCRSYDARVDGRDRQIVERLAGWLIPVVTRVLAGKPRDVLDVGCGEQPLRSVVENAGSRYIGFDVEQNTASTVQIQGAIDAPLPYPWPDTTSAYDVVLCTEVLEHVFNWPAALHNIRRLTKDGGVVIVTVPFIFPLHLEPIDYFRTTKFAMPLLARDHGFEVEELVTLGDGRDVLLTLLEDLSILPASSSFRARVSARVMRRTKNALVAGLRARSTAVAMNSNFYLSNAAVLRAV